ncbi:hypothetical protein ANN_19038 [Periplaneta americana]|uniref:DDE Tnp4 domain-containing protein n=1 Tax=Periplaneta americana TaxID=6978 RepID=A0ABQ8SQE1_PERAM|nr:hypothetical protein ANN_19038 [Periplaneta americana]
MACCDADYKFIWADIGAYGAESDGGVFRRSKIGKKLENGSAELPEPRTLPGSNILMSYFFVADEAFPLKQYIMRPYPVKTAESIIKATLCLHNYLRTEACSQHSSQNLGDWREITRNDTNFRSVGRMGSNIATQAIYKLRDNLADYLVSDAGAISYQHGYVNNGR